MNTRPFSWMICVGAFLAFMVSCPLRFAAQSQSPLTDLRGQVIDENGQPVPRVEVDLRFGSGSSQTIYTDTVGRFQLRTASISQVHLSLSKPGFFRIEDRVLDLAPGVTEITLTLNHETEVKEQLEVQSEPVQIDPDTTSHQESLVQHEIVNVPVPSSHDLQQSLRTIPQVLADASGRLHVAGGRQGQTEVLLDGFEINDPASGNFTSKVDVDAVRTVTIETGNWYPRLSTSGPLRKGKAWFSDALSIQRNFVLVSELPIGQNIDTIWSGDNLLRGQMNLTSRNVLQGSFLFNGSTDPRRGLGVFSPLSTTSNFKSRRYFVSLKDQIWVGRTLIDVGAAVDTGGTDSNPQGTLPFVVTPSSASGNYFQSYSQHSRRLQLVGNLTTGALELYGTHTVSAGWNADGVDFTQTASRSGIDYQRSDTSLSDRATFSNRDGSSGPAAFRMANTQFGGYVQDLWRPWKPIVFSVGVRTDWDRLIHENVFQPRIAMNWVPAGDGRMKFTLAWGKHYQPLYLTVFGLASDQQRTDQFYNPPPTPCMPPAACPTPTTAGPPVVSSFSAPLHRV